MSLKIQIGLAKGKKQYDKRNAEKERDWERDKARIMRAANKKQYNGDLLWG